MSTFPQVSAPQNRTLIISKVSNLSFTPPESGLDNLMVDSKGAIWAAGLPKVLATRAHILDPAKKPSAPSSVFKITLNIGESSFYGEKYLVQKVLEDDGTKISGASSAAHDATRGRLFIHGLVGESLIVCQTK